MKKSQTTNPARPRGAFAPRAGRMLAPSRTPQTSTLDFVQNMAKTTLDVVQFAHSTTLGLDILHPDGRSNSPFRRARNRSARDIQNCDIQPCVPSGWRSGTYLRHRQRTQVRESVLPRVDSPPQLIASQVRLGRAAPSSTTLLP